MFRPTVAISTYEPVPVLRSILRPFSLSELSFKVRSILLFETALAVRAVGAAGITTGEDVVNEIALYYKR